MCGIAGMFGTAGERALDRMLEAIRHRGPDDQGKLVEAGAGVALGHNRLTIIDLSERGRQPMSNEDGRLWLVFNGEIYNFKALRAELEASGRHRFRSHTDSEVILHLYEELGQGAVRRLEGMFAFVLWDRTGGRVLMARDPLGIKPLYLGFGGDGTLYFASEIRALLEQAEEVHEFPAGHLFAGTPGELQRWVTGGMGVGTAGPVPYWQLPTPTREIDRAEEAVQRVRETLDRAVAKRLVADVPVGVFLSGGLDSSLVAAVARRQVKGELHSFAVGVKGSPDLEYSKLVAGYLGTTHHVLEYTAQDVIEVLPEVVRMLESFDPALVRSAIANHMVCRLARRRVKVVLSGEGADELFAGYHYLADLDRERLDEELRWITGALHNTNLQRADRLSMAHALELRVPFLDRELVELAFRIAPELKHRGLNHRRASGREAQARGAHGREGREGRDAVRPEKWVLRKAAEAYLPETVVWRVKEKFSIGTGTGQILEAYAERTISDQEFERERRLPTGELLPVKEALLYWRIFRESFGERHSLLRGMGRSRSLNPGRRYPA